MACNLSRLLSAAAASLRAFRSDTAGQIVIVFAAASTALVAGVGSGVDLSRAYVARQKISQVATLACQYSTRQSVTTVGVGTSTYIANVNKFAATSLAAQNWSGTTPTDGASTTTANYYSYSSTNGGKTILYASVPTTFLKLFKVTSIPIHTEVDCQNETTSLPKDLLDEGFETTCTTYCFISPTGTSSAQSTPTTSFPSSPAYTGSSGTQWYITGYCLETDKTGQINATSPEGSHSAELDCDNGSGSAGNSAISTKVYMPVGYYELRYFYRSRRGYPDYDPLYVCASTAGDLSWANDTGSSGLARDNQLNVYFDRNTTGAAPMHTTTDGKQQLGGANLIDMCVYSSAWVERSVRIKVTTADYYWLSFAADGANDSYGGQLDNIRFCVGTCSGTPQDNFPSSWLAANNGGTNPVLFEDTFDGVSVPSSFTGSTSNRYVYTGTNLGASTGTGVLANQGIDTSGAAGWASPYNQINVGTKGAYQGSQYIALDGVGGTTTNRLISRPMILDPGYYQVSYNYMSEVNFALSLISCTAAPSSGYIYGPQGNATATVRFGSSGTYNGFTNVLGVFMSHGGLISTPNFSSTQSATPGYTNPDGTTSTTPTVAPDKVNWAAYDSTAVNPVLDVCGYVNAWAWYPRSVSIKITKPGIYWLSFSTTSSVADGAGAAIDDVKVTALGSPFMSNPPTSPLVTIPVPNPQPDSNYTNNGAFDGFYTVADPFQPTADES